MMKKILIFCLALMAVSCIYPFNPEVVDASGTLVIEGDILIGNKTTVTVGHTVPINSPNMEPLRPSGKVWVENDAGEEFDGIEDPFNPGIFSVDTQNADPGKNYRLHFLDRDTGKEYVSSWERVCVAPEIDSLSYNLNYEKETLFVALSMHSKGESYFKWNYAEDWRYHSIFSSMIKFVVTSDNPRNQSGYLEYRDYLKENIYTCYRHEVSRKIMTFSTEKQTDDRFVDLEFLPIDRHDLRIQDRYRIVVDLEPLSKDAYLYWENIKANSEYNGNLFAPNPSELVGNIRCVQEPDELVMGYVNVAQISRKQLIIDDIDINFYQTSEPYLEPEEVRQNQWVEYYFNKRYLPYATVFPPGDLSLTYWAPSRCVDCKEYGGGTYERPDDWQ